MVKERKKQTNERMDKQRNKVKSEKQMDNKNPQAAKYL